MKSGSSAAWRSRAGSMSLSSLTGLYCVAAHNSGSRRLNNSRARLSQLQFRLNANSSRRPIREGRSANRGDFILVQATLETLNEVFQFFIRHMPHMSDTKRGLLDRTQS